MTQEHPTAAVQRYLNDLAGDSPAEPVVRALLDRAVRQLHKLCATVLYWSYPRLTRPPVNLQVDKMLGVVVERLKALREVRRANVRHNAESRIMPRETGFLGSPVPRTSSGRYSR
jgi:RNA polymerase sigma-70 factor (ECF subfamily)